MSREYPSRPIIGVGGVVFIEGRVVLIKRRHPPLQGRWSLPGGGVHVGETLREAVQRELREEIGIDTRVGPLIDLFDHITREPDGHTWGPFDVDRGLPSVACMGAVIKGPVRADGTWDLWASFPSSAGRRDGQIAVSSDNGRTWRIVKVIHGPFAYSALQVSPDRLNLLCFYESAGYRSETLIRIPFNRLRGPAIGSR